MIHRNQIPLPGMHLHSKKSSEMSDSETCKDILKQGEGRLKHNIGSGISAPSATVNIANGSNPTGAKPAEKLEAGTQMKNNIVPSAGFSRDKLTKSGTELLQVALSKVLECVAAVAFSEWSGFPQLLPFLEYIL